MAPPEPVPVGWDKVQQPEVGVLKVDQREQIRRAYFIEGKSIRQIALEGHHHRRTVRHALRDASPPRYTHRQPRARPVLGPFVHLIDQWLAEDLTRPVKQRHTAHRIYQRLIEEHGFTGKEANLRQYVREHRPTPRPSRLFIPLTYQPGEDAQCDFGEAQVILAGRPVKVQLFCIRLCYSKVSFVMALPHQQQEAFFEGHQQAFGFFGGVPRHIWYDNLSQAVRPRLLGHRPQEQESFVAFRSHYLFESRFCTPAQAHEKGLVEGLVGYARRNFLVPVPEVNSFQELNDLLRERCLAEAQRRLRGESATIAELWDQERPHLLPLPTHSFPCCRTVPVRPNRLSLVTFQTNRYSVPVEWANHSLFLRAFVERVEISNGSRVLAVHPRCYQREQDVLNPFHYLPLLRERPGALDHAKPLKHWPHPPILDQYLAALRDRLPQRVATLEFVRVLELCSRYPLNQVAQGVEQALLSKSLSSDTVAYFLNTGQAMTSRSVPIPLTRLPAGPSVQERDLRQYDLLLGRCS
jgi:transposase